MSPKNARTLSIRLDATDTAALADFEDRTGVDGVTLGRNALRACISYFQSGGTITFPLVLLPAASPLDPVPPYLRDAPLPGAKARSKQAS
jgi:hypothetical protein